MLFDRVYRLLIGKKGSNNGIEIESLRINFSIQKTWDKNPNNSKIQIWNLNKSSREELEKPDTRVLLYAGYAEDAGPLLIFQGDIAFAWSKFDGPDIITEFDLKDGLKEIRDTTISVGYNKGVKSTQVLNDVAKKMEVPLTLASDAPTREWQNGLSHHGSARGLLDKVARATNLEWSIQNGNLQVLERGMVTTRQGFDISQDSGMVGSPESKREAEAQKGGGSKKSKGKQPKKYWYGWEVKTLLIPTLLPGDRVILNTKTVEGVFRIEELTHTGDNWDGDWQTQLTLVDPAKPIGNKNASKGGKSPRGDAALEDAAEDAGLFD